MAFSNSVKNVLNFSRHFTEQGVYSAASMESYCALTGRRHWVSTTAAMVICVILIFL